MKIEWEDGLIISCPRRYKYWVIKHFDQYAARDGDNAVLCASLEEAKAVVEAWIALEGTV